MTAQGAPAVSRAAWAGALRPALALTALHVAASLSIQHQIIQAVPEEAQPFLRLVAVPTALATAAAALLVLALCGAVTWACLTLAHREPALESVLGSCRYLAWVLCAYEAVRLGLAWSLLPGQLGAGAREVAAVLELFDRLEAGTWGRTLAAFDAALIVLGPFAFALGFGRRHGARTAALAGACAAAVLAAVRVIDRVLP